MADSDVQVWQPLETAPSSIISDAPRMTWFVGLRGDRTKPPVVVARIAVDAYVDEYGNRVRGLVGWAPIPKSFP